MEDVAYALELDVTIKIREELIQSLFEDAGIECTDYKLKRINKIIRDEKADVIEILEDATLEFMMDIICQKWKRAKA